MPMRTSLFAVYLHALRAESRDWAEIVRPEVRAPRRRQETQREWRVEAAVDNGEERVTEAMLHDSAPR